MLYRLYNNILIIGLLTLGFISVIAADRAFCSITLVTVFSFVTQVLLILCFIDKNKTIYSEKYLFLTVFVYSCLIGGLYYIVAYYNNNLDLQLNDPDAALYYRESVKSVHLGYLENVKRMVRIHDFDDLGALMFTNFMLYISPSEYFVNVFYMFTGAISAVLLFRIGKFLMPVSHAFLAALAYSTSSFLILLHCTFLKESLFVLLVISAMYFFYKATAGGNNSALLGVALFVTLIAFFRPAVDAFLILSFVGYYAVTQRRSAISLFLYGIIAVGVVVSMTFMQSQVDSYTAGGDRDAILAEAGSSNYSGGFNFFVGWFVALFGPFPTLFPMEGFSPQPMHFYGAGLTSKLFLSIPFWIGMYYAVKLFDVRMIPLALFVGVEMAASAYVMASLELRKVMLHIPFTFVVSFYGLYNFGKSVANERTRHLLELSCYVVTICVLLLWNVIRVK